MLKMLNISNRSVTIDNINIRSYIKKLDYITINGLIIYEIPEVCFCGANGKLTVYTKQGCIRKLSFLALNPLNIYDISSSFNFDAYDTFLANLKGNYRQKSETEFYNRNFDFKLIANNNNYMIIVKGRQK